MATDMFLKLGDIKGESRDQAHRDEIEISRWGWGMSQTGSMHSGSGGGAGKVNIDNLSISKVMDKSSPNLMMACSTGKHYPEARRGEHGESERRWREEEGPRAWGPQVREREISRFAKRAEVFGRFLDRAKQPLN